MMSSYNTVTLPAAVLLLQAAPPAGPSPGLRTLSLTGAGISFIIGAITFLASVLWS